MSDDLLADIRNKLTPIVNYFEMKKNLNELINESKIKDKTERWRKIVKLKKLLNKEEKQVFKSLDYICELIKN